MRIFTVSEAYGPYSCEHTEDGKKCGAAAYCIVLSDDENNLLPKETGPSAVRYIMDNRLGTVLCEDHGGV